MIEIGWLKAPSFISGSVKEPLGMSAFDGRNMIVPGSILDASEGLTSLKLLIANALFLLGLYKYLLCF